VNLFVQLPQGFTKFRVEVVLHAIVSPICKR
jgi:hypothetical protein